MEVAPHVCSGGGQERKGSWKCVGGGKRKWGKQGKIMQHCTLFSNQNGKKRQEKTKIGQEAG